MNSALSPSERRDLAAASGRLESPHAGGADRDDSSAARVAALDRGAELRRDAEPLGVQLMVLDALGSHRRERARADVQREERATRRRGRRAARAAAESKCKPAVGAATAPGERANTVW